MVTDASPAIPDVSEFYRGPHIEITHRWFGCHVVSYTFSAIFWNTVLVILYISAIRDGDIKDWFILFSLGHIIAGVCMAYYAIAGWFNQTCIFVDSIQIAVRHKPFPWAGREIDVSEVKQLYTKRASHSKNGSDYTYGVHVITHSGKDKKLVEGLESNKHAVFIRQEIEKYLNIVDVSAAESRSVPTP